jgi:hypothetical protein
MQTKLLLITPPFTQLNTPYPATSYLKGFLEGHQVSVSHCDLSIELFTSVFTSDFLVQLFKEAKYAGSNFFPGVKKMKQLYCNLLTKLATNNFFLPYLNIDSFFIFRARAYFSKFDNYHIFYVCIEKVRMDVMKT